MRIGIDCRTILNPHGGEGAGIGHYTYYLVKNLLEIDQENHYVLFFDSKIYEQLDFIKPHHTTVLLPLARYKKFLPFFYSHILVSAVMRAQKLDVLHGPANTISLYYNNPSVITVHDLAIYRHPEWFPSHQNLSTKVIVPKSIKKAKKIIAVSEVTKKDIQDIFAVPKNNIEVIYEGAFSDENINYQKVKNVLDNHNLKGRLIVSISTLEPRKNFTRLIKAFDELLKSSKHGFDDVQLVLGGAKGWKYEEIFDAIEASPHKDKIHYLGYISHEEKIQLLKTASVFAFPTLYEGFGIGNLEAMACGVPVLTSNIPPVKEVVGNAAKLVNPESISDIARGLEDILNSETLQEDLIRKGTERIKEFSWKMCAQKTLKVYETIGSKKNVV